MFSNNDEENRGYSYNPPEDTSWESRAPQAQSSMDNAPPAGAPVEMSEQPAPAEAPYTPQVYQPPFRNDQGIRDLTQRTDAWREPMYSAAHETPSNMYTPGIYVDQPVPRKYTAETEPDHKKREHSGRIGGLLRAVCLVIVCAVFSGAATYGVMEYRLSRGDFNTTNQVVLGNPSTSNPQSAGLTSPVATASTGMSAEDIYDLACVQVVSVDTKMSNDMQSSFGIFGESTIIPGSTAPGTTTVASGSGFIISSDGYILTNYHVVQTSHEHNLPLIVSLNDGTEYNATVIGFDESSDVALIKIDATGLNAAVITNSDNIRAGQRVYAVGNPFGDLNYTMTEGIVSALDRVTTVDGKSINTFQFSAAVNPGNSGGPVYNEYGEIIGIVSVKIMGNSVEGIGFAIPINDAISIASELIEHGYITGRAYMGITAETVSRANADYFSLVEGAYVKTVSEGSAADKAGLLFGDIITKIGDYEINTRESLVSTLRKFRAGDTTTLTVWRGGKEIELTITFDENLTAGQPLKP